MDPNDETIGSSFCRDEEKVKAMDLLEESWFFENLFNTRRPRIPRCKSDLCSSLCLVNEPVLLKGRDSDESANTSTSEIAEEEEEENCQKRSSFSRSRLLHQSSDPLVLEAAIKAHSREMKEVNKKRESNGSRSKLLRTPSLPPFIGREEKFHVCDHKPGKQTSKSNSIPRIRSERNTEGDNSLSAEGIKEMRRRYLLKQRTMRKSLSDLELEEVQGFKNLGFSFEKETISPSVASIIPGLQEKNREETEEDKAVRRPYLSEGWLLQSWVPPPIPTYTTSKSSKHMKQHIKCWARAVASHVRQEC